MNIRPVHFNECDTTISNCNVNGMVAMHLEKRMMIIYFKRTSELRVDSVFECTKSAKDYNMQL